MDDAKETSTDFIRQESKTEFDAVHPRFIVQQSAEEIRNYQIEHDYFCEQCGLYFAPTLLGLQTHFDRLVAEHQPLGSCVYCKGPVYCYKFNEREELYHNCPREK